MIGRDYRPTAALGELPDSGRTVVRQAMDQMLLVLVERAGGEPITCEWCGDCRPAKDSVPLHGVS